MLSDNQADNSRLLSWTFQQNRANLAVIIYDNTNILNQISNWSRKYIKINLNSRFVHFKKFKSPNQLKMLD